MAAVGSQLGHFAVAQGIATVAGAIYQALDASHTPSVATASDTQQLGAVITPTAGNNADSTIIVDLPTSTRYVQLEHQPTHVALSGETCLALTFFLLLAILLTSWWLAPSLQDEHESRAAKHAFGDQQALGSTKKESLAEAREEKYARLMLKCLPLLELIDTIEEYRKLTSERFTRLTDACLLGIGALTEAGNATDAQVSAHNSTRDRLSSAQREIAELQKRLDDVSSEHESTQVLLTRAKSTLFSEEAKYAKLTEANKVANEALDALRKAHDKLQTDSRNELQKEKAAHQLALDMLKASTNAECTKLSAAKSESDEAVKRYQKESAEKQLDINDLVLQLEELKGTATTHEGNDEEVKVDDDEDEPMQDGESHENHDDDQAKDVDDIESSTEPSCASQETEIAQVPEEQPTVDNNVPKFPGFTFQASSGESLLPRPVHNTPKIKDKPRTKRGGRGRSSKYKKTPTSSMAVASSQTMTPTATTFTPDINVPSLSTSTFGMTQSYAEDVDDNAFFYQIPQPRGRWT
ncbi:hypothetical protein Slin14017_G016480 [Septoria linicola]|nr:hypothetical protein Slin14017_G016480 [Septoria linicola]